MSEAADDLMIQFLADRDQLACWAATLADIVIFTVTIR
jgi:hypothetical protein